MLMYGNVDVNPLLMYEVVLNLSLFLIKILLNHHLKQFILYDIVNLVSRLRNPVKRVFDMYYQVFFVIIYKKYI